MFGHCRDKSEMWVHCVRRDMQKPVARTKL